MTDEATPLRDLLAFATDALVVRDMSAVRVQRLHRNGLSYSAASNVASCPSRFAIESLLVPVETPFQENTLGTSGHKVLELLYSLPAAERTTSKASDIINNLIATHPEEIVFPDDPIQQGVWRSEVSARIAGLWKIEDPTKIVVVSNEMAFRGRNGALVGGVPANGFIDRVDHEGAGDDGLQLRVVDYKGLALDTPLPTPTGWTTMGQVAEGDQLLGANGQPTTIIGKSSIHHRPCYRITFSDGSTVVCDNVHLWNVTEIVRDVHTTSTVNADQLHAMMLAAKQQGRPESLVISNTAATELPNADLPLDPWVLGAWLGDGFTKTGSLTVGAQDLNEMLVLVKEHWHGEVSVTGLDGGVRTVTLGKRTDRCVRDHDLTSVATYVSNGKANRPCPACAADRHAGSPGVMTNPTLRRALANAGLLLNKHIPAEYLRASKGQRLALLRGLMDTDGSWNPRRRRAVFVNTNKVIADGVAELALMLGVTVQRFTNAETGGSPAYVVEFRPVGFNPFALPRKASQVDAYLRAPGFEGHATRRVIISMEPTASVPTQCVMVDAADSLYLCGPTMVPTHNTGKVKKPYKSNDSHGDQLRTYVLAYQSVRGQLPTRASVHYTRFGETRDVDLSPSALRKTTNFFTKAWETVQTSAESGVYEAKPSPLCPWCPLATVCPSAADAGRNKPGRTQKPEDFAAITEVGDRLQLPLLSTLTAVNLETTMTEAPKLIQHPYLHDDKAFEELSHGTLNPNSYASGAAYGLVELAVETLEANDVTVSPKSVRALSATFASIIEQVQRQVTRTASFQEGAHTRLRGALRVTLRSFGVPFGADAESWAEWQVRVVKRIAAIANTAYWLWDLSATGFGTEAYLDLTGEGTPAAPAAPAVESAPEPTPEPAPAAEPVAEVAPEPTPEPTPEPAAPTAAPVADDDFETIDDTTAPAAVEPTPEPTPAPAPEPVAAERTPEPTRELVTVGAAVTESEYDPSDDF